MIFRKSHCLKRRLPTLAPKGEICDRIFISKEKVLIFIDSLKFSINKLFKNLAIYAYFLIVEKQNSLYSFCLSAIFPWPINSFIDRDQ